MKNITIATETDIGYYNIMEDSCKKHNLELVRLGKDVKWTSFSLKYKLWLDYLVKLPENEIVMINDAYDVIFLEDSEKIINKFKKFNKPIVFSIQKGVLIESTFHKCLENVICTGNMIGYVKNIKEIINIILDNEELWRNQDDQMIFNDICKLEKDYFINNIGLDTNQEIFFVTSADDIVTFDYLLYKNIPNLKLKDNKLVNKDDKPISVLHLAALLNGNKYLEKLGYDVNKVKPAGSYKAYHVLLLTIWTIWNVVIKFIKENTIVFIILVLIICYFSLKQLKPFKDYFIV